MSGEEVEEVKDETPLLVAQAQPVVCLPSNHRCDRKERELSELSAKEAAELS